jgi:4-diphosphocytidyl-2-C-methyl-D-erythritol kinase
VLAFSAFSGRVEVRARAKVNLGLEVLGRRADGYHELRSVMWAIDLADRVTLEPGGDGMRQVAPDVPDSGQPGPARCGLCAGRRGGGRAADPDRQAHPWRRLGGGSTDAAAVLGRARWESAGRGQSAESMAVALGMHVPFFLPEPGAGWDAERRSGRCGASRDQLVPANPLLSTREVYARLSHLTGDGRQARRWSRRRRAWTRYATTASA